jgi:hypothetical protein
MRPRAVHFNELNGQPLIESMMENYPEFPVANLNYAGGHAGHQTK